MADLFVLSGSYSTTPQVGSPSGVASIPAPIDEEAMLIAKYYNTFTLTNDAPLSVQFGGVTKAHVVIVKVTGQKIRLRLTSTEGSQQAVPVDTWYTSISRTVPITAIDLTRTVGAQTIVDIFLGQMTP